VAAPPLGLGPTRGCPAHTEPSPSPSPGPSPGPVGPGALGKRQSLLHISTAELLVAGPQRVSVLSLRWHRWHPRCPPEAQMEGMGFLQQHGCSFHAPEGSRQWRRGPDLSPCPWSGALMLWDGIPG